MLLWPIEQRVGRFACNQEQMPRFTHRTAFALAWLVLCPLLARLLRASAHVPHNEAAARAEAAKFRGVSYYKRGRVFVARLYAGGRPPYIGRFQSAQKAAEAYDQEVRCLYPDATPDHQFRRKNWLNFPSEEEAAYDESPEQARKRGMRTRGSNHRKEARSFELVEQDFDASLYSEKYELVRLTGSSKADDLFKLRGSSQAGLPIQLKAAESEWKQSKEGPTSFAICWDMMAWWCFLWRWMVIACGLPLARNSRRLSCA